MAITKILNIQESEGRNPASHLKNALEYIQNPDKTEECILVGGINCLPDTAFEQMEETKNIFHKTGKRQGYHVIISFSPEEKVTAEQAMYVLVHFAKDVLGNDYEAVYAVHTDREHMHGHLIWNSVSMTTGKKYNSPKGNWKNHLQPITNKYCDELGLSIMPAEYSRNPKNISRDKWEKEMSMKEIILRDAKMCAYAAGNVEHFKYLMKRLGYVFKKDAWMEVQAPGFRYYHKLAKLDEMFSEDMLRHYVDMPWMSKPYFYSSDIRGLHRAKLSPFQKKFYAKLYRLRIVEQKRFVVGGAKYTEDLKRFHQLQDEYLLIINNDIKSVVDLVYFIGEQEEKIQQIEDRQKEIYRESSSRKRSIKNEEQYREYQIWHMEVQEELDELKLEKRNVKRQIQLADDIIKEDLYTAYYAVTGKEEIVADRDVEIPGMEEDTEVEKATAVFIEPDVNIEVMNPNNNQNEIGRQKEQADSARKQQTDLEGIGTPEIHNSSNVNVTRVGESMTDVTDKGEYVETKENEPVDKVSWIVRRISELGGYENVSDSVKADIFGFDIADVGGSIRLFSEVMKRLKIKLDEDELFEEFQKVYDKSIGRDANKAEDKMWNRGRGR
ncbi:relaxase/mobilization nuclease domain-containing protein [Dorea formicigenerans]|uniref:relaxase/mobilization nuclease domain-containing protein n=1 Tax=Dorea formicigenerans TaxID=39486 RepID=UPI00156F57B8|nr:relaxase/mobilization nuclease domain-containing protein [Dorea formicigenerans]NSE86281.1 relaxase/mobilization nuclease domain-containing protein [Dorea formicigenerans]